MATAAGVYTSNLATGALVPMPICLAEFCRITESPRVVLFCQTGTKPAEPVPDRLGVADLADFPSVMGAVASAAACGDAVALTWRKAEAGNPPRVSASTALSA